LERARNTERGNGVLNKKMTKTTPWLCHIKRAQKSNGITGKQAVEEGFSRGKQCSTR